MKLIIFALCMLASSAHANSIADWLKVEFGEAHYRAHIISAHVPTTNTNNGNLGAGIKTRSGFIAGAYHNSYYKFGRYVGWESPEWIPRVSVEFVLISGYEHISGLEWTPGITPNIRLYTLDQHELRNLGLDWKEASLRMLVVPKHDKDGVSIGLYHFGAEAKF